MPKSERSKNENTKFCFLCLQDRARRTNLRGLNFKAPDRSTRAGWTSDMEARDPRMDQIRSPYDGSVVGEMPLANERDVEEAICAAQRGFQIMRRLPRFVRADILLQASEILKARREEAARTISAEAGKPIFDARGEVSRATFNLANAAAEARRISGEEIPLDMDAGIFEYQTTGKDGARIDLSKVDDDQLQAASRRIGIARRFPIGPILAIAPFNFPLNLVLHKVAPALAVGNSVVLKPAPQTPLTSLLLAEILREAGLPEGALTVVHCSVPLAEKDGDGRAVRDGDIHGIGQGRLAYQGNCGTQTSRAGTRR